MVVLGVDELGYPISRENSALVIVDHWIALSSYVLHRTSLHGRRRKMKVQGSKAFVNMTVLVERRLGTECHSERKQQSFLKLYGSDYSHDAAPAKDQMRR